jgi:HTH-type transcriptional regulator/antitoxin HigA
MAERRLVGSYAPAELLREELAARGWSTIQFAQLLGMEARTVQEVLDATRGITGEMAIMIGEVLGTGPELWLNLENQFQLDSMRARPT